jgi:hypothetical protein
MKIQDRTTFNSNLMQLIKIKKVTSQLKNLEINLEKSS